jgi:hypothetical protein
MSLAGRLRWGQRRQGRPAERARSPSVWTAGSWRAPPNVFGQCPLDERQRATIPRCNRFFANGRRADDDRGLSRFHTGRRLSAWARRRRVMVWPDGRPAPDAGFSIRSGGPGPSRMSSALSVTRPKLRKILGGPGGNRTHIRGFAVRCITTLPPDQTEKGAVYRGCHSVRSRPAMPAIGDVGTWIPSSVPGPIMAPGNSRQIE